MRKDVASGLFDYTLIIIFTLIFLVFGFKFINSFSIFNVVIFLLSFTLIAIYIPLVKNFFDILEELKYKEVKND